jgi:hypothetical protein
VRAAPAALIEDRFVISKLVQAFGKFNYSSPMSQH